MCTNGNLIMPNIVKSSQDYTQIVGNYTLGEVIGAGEFDSRIRKCTHNKTGKTYAIKIYDKCILTRDSWKWQQIEEAIKVLRI